MEDKNIESFLKNLIYLNSVIATELLQITENTSKALRGSVPPSCLEAHNKIRDDVLEILEKDCPQYFKSLETHLKNH